MFDNLVGQPSIKYIASDMTNHTFPGAVLFSGEDTSGKLTAALEIARIYSCQNNPKGKWSCKCSSCLQHKALTCSNLLLLGPRDCTLEISAAKETFLKALKSKEEYLSATRYLFIRSVRKLTLRFSGLLWKGDSNINKISALIESINENLEIIDFPRDLPEYEEVEKICDTLEKDCYKLEKDFLYDSIPVNQIRNMEDWARIKSEFGKKTIILENADRMSDSVRNAILKILEEPPADCSFILLTSKRNSILPTILSRVRNYDFKHRPKETQSKVIDLVFHNKTFDGSISDYLLSYLPVPSEKIKQYAYDFYKSLVTGSIPNVSELIKNCNSFEPRIELKLFLNSISSLQKPLFRTSIGCEAVFETSKALQRCWENITLYNQSITGAFETLVRELNKINITHGRILCEGM